MILTIKEIVDVHKFDVICGEEYLSNAVTRQEVSRPGMELAGLFDFYEHDRIQVVGSKELAFLGWLNEQDKEIRVRMLFEKRPPLFVFSKHTEIPEVFIRNSGIYQVPIVRSQKKTSALISSLYLYLSSRLSERLSLHGTLVDISGVGVLIRGKSGLGKSEVALELVRRGHQLVADDRVDIYQRELGIVIGEAPDILKKYLEIRGIGIINVVKLFGAKAYKENKKIMLVVDLEKWDNSVMYDRLGLDEEFITFFDSKISYVKIPVSEGRNIASLVEVAAINARLKYLGTNTAREFAEELNQELQLKNSNKERGHEE